MTPAPIRSPEPPPEASVRPSPARMRRRRAQRRSDERPEPPGATHRDERERVRAWRGWRGRDLDRSEHDGIFARAMGSCPRSARLHRRTAGLPIRYPSAPSNLSGWMPLHRISVWSKLKTSNYTAPSAFLNAARYHLPGPQPRGVRGAVANRRGTGAVTGWQRRHSTPLKPLALGHAGGVGRPAGEPRHPNQLRFPAGWPLPPLPRFTERICA